MFLYKFLARKNVGKKKKSILTSRVVNKLRHTLRFEQELYDYALQRLDFQLRSLGMEPRPSSK